MRLLLIRHGQTTANLTRLLDTGAPGAALTELGQEQAAALPAALAGEAIDSLYSSDLLRAQQTIRPLAGALGLPVNVRDGLREIRAGELEMKNDRASIALYHEVSFGWVDGDLERRMPGGENGFEVFDRFGSVIREAAKSASGTVALVSHGQVIRSWVAANTDNIDLAYARKHLLHNTAVVVVEGTPADGWTAVSWAGEAVGGRRVDEGAATGPGGERD